MSTQDQNLEMQLEALTKASRKNLVAYKITGTRVERPGLIRVQESLRKEDTLVVW